MMNEERVFFEGGGVALEGLFAPSDGTQGVVVTHPHSLMGGSMTNNVVDALVTTFHENGFSTLRFNFRGVGRSEGTFDHGTGEQDDVKGAIAFLEGKGCAEITLAGYSFGAWVMSRLFPGMEYPSDIIMVSPPIDFVDFDFSGVKGTCGLIICGDRDQFCPRGEIQRIAHEIACPLEIITGADHFYFGKERGIRTALDNYLQK